MDRYLAAVHRPPVSELHSWADSYWHKGTPHPQDFFASRAWRRWQAAAVRLATARNSPLQEGMAKGRRGARGCPEGRERRSCRLAALTRLANSFRRQGKTVPAGAGILRIRKSGGIARQTCNRRPATTETELNKPHDLVLRARLYDVRRA